MTIRSFAACCAAVLTTTGALHAQSPRFLQRSDSERTSALEALTAPAYGKRISLNLESISRADALGRISRMTGLSFVFANDLLPGGSVRLVGDTFTVRSALAAVLASADVDVIVGATGNAILVRRPAPIRSLVLTGNVRDTVSLMPLSGAVVSVLDSARVPLAQAIADSAGRYSLELSPAAAGLRVVRIGYQPRLLPMPRRREARATVDIGMSKLPTLLSAVAVNDERLCSLDADRAGARSLWEQARAALLATVVARESNPSQSTVFSYERVVEAGNGRVIRQASRRLTGRATRPYAAAEPPRVLAERGYADTDSMGRRYLAPDADVLLDESFAGTHCFSVRQPDAGHRNAVGLAFEPAKGRDAIVDVRGVLWMSADVPSIRSLEFQFTGHDPAVAVGPADGVLFFHPMANGVSFVDEWKMRLPIREARERSTESVQHLLPDAGTRRSGRVSETGGIVVSSRWPDGLKWESSLPAITGVVTRESSSLPVPCARVILASAGDTVHTDSLGRFRFAPVLPGIYSIFAADSVPDASRLVASHSVELNVVLGAPVEIRLELPVRNDGTVRACGMSSADRRGSQ